MKELIRHILREHLVENKINYTDDELESIAKKYPHKNMFRKQDGFAFRQAEKKGILDKITSHMTYGGKKFSDDELEKIAKKYKTKKEFYTNERGAYSTASTRGILDNITSHMETLGSKSKRMVYSYEFPDYNAAYVGLTCNEESRKLDHTSCEVDRKKRSSVLKFILEKGVQPLYKNISKGYIDYKDAQNLEIKTIEKYKSEGWEVLNKVKGGGLGGAAFVVSNEEIENIAKNYNNKSDFKKLEPAAYQLASKRKLLSKITQHMSSKLTSLDFDDVMNTASKYQNKTEFSVNDPKAYSAAVRKGWIEDVSKHMTGNSKFSDQELEKIAKNYKTKIDFKKGNRRAYSRAVARGIIDKISTHMIKPPIHNLKYSKEDFMNAAKKYKTRPNLYNNDKKLYDAASKREGMFDLMFPPK